MYMNFFKHQFNIKDQQNDRHIIYQRVKFVDVDEQLEMGSLIKNDHTLCDFVIDESRAGIGYLKTPNIYVDFANQSIGGSLLRGGAVQEEIMFANSSLATVSLLFCTTMKNNDAIRITGTQAVSETKGYSHSLKFVGDSQRITEEGFKATIVAIDAIDFRADPNTQFQAEQLKREILKAVAGVYVDEETDEKLPQTVETGNWGCGVFRGDFQLKALLQWIAVSLVKKDIIYYPFGEELLEDLGRMVQVLQQRKITIGYLMTLILAFSRQSSQPKIFDFIFARLNVN